jgi:DNA-binding ferritin-like protein
LLHCIKLINLNGSTTGATFTQTVTNINEIYIEIRNRLFEIQSAKLFLISEEIGRQIIALGHYVVMSNEDFFLNSNLNAVNYKNWSKQETTKKIMETHLKIKIKIEEWNSLTKNAVDQNTSLLIDKIIFNHKEMIKELKL